jgi:MarR family transcriptional regulator, lower aerobic nicotinate degradation pathway regulator
MTVLRPDKPIAPRPPRELRSSPAYLLKRLAMAIKERTAAALEGSGLSPYDHGILALLDEEPPETQATIADALGYDRSHLVGVLDDLEERGLIERRRDPSDRRRQVVTLTPAGKEALTRIRTVAKRVEEEFFEPLDAAERGTLLELLTQLAGHHDARLRANGGS